MKSEAASILNVTGNLTLTANDDKTVSEFKGIVNVSKDKNRTVVMLTIRYYFICRRTQCRKGNFTSRRNVTFTGNATIEGTTRV